MRMLDPRNTSKPARAGFRGGGFDILGTDPDTRWNSGRRWTSRLSLRPMAANHDLPRARIQRAGRCYAETCHDQR